MEHLKGFGRLGEGERVVSPYRYVLTIISAYLMVPVVLSWTGSMITPFSTAFEMLKTARDIAHVMNIVASAKCEPIIVAVRHRLVSRKRRGAYLGKC